jgi:hypothetical protein
MGIASQVAGLNVSRYLVIITVLTAIGLTIYSVIYQAAKFDIQAFGIGMAAVLFGGGGMMYMNPSPKEVSVNPPTPLPGPQQ